MKIKPKEKEEEKKRGEEGAKKLVNRVKKTGCMLFLKFVNCFSKLNFD